MFIVKFFESMFTNGLKGNPAPSFLPAYILAWSYFNSSFLVYFLAANGDMSKKISAAIKAESISMFIPVWIALFIIVVVPWIKNIGLAAREGADYCTQKLLDKWEVKSYKTAAEYDHVFALQNQAKEDAQKSQLEIASLTAEYQKERNDASAAIEGHLFTIKELKKEINENEQRTYTDETLEWRFNFSVEYIDLLKDMLDDLRLEMGRYNQGLKVQSLRKLEVFVVGQQENIDKMDNILRDDEEIKRYMAKKSVAKIKRILSDD